MKTPFLSVFFVAIIGCIVITFTACTKKRSSPGVLKPVITSVFPDSGHFGTIVTITGKNFDPYPAANTVTIDGVPAKVNEASDTSITITVPVTSTGVVAVKTIDSTSGPVFNYTHDIFVTGLQTKAGGGYFSRAICWINGLPVLLTNPGNNAAANGIASSGNDVYVVGYEYSGRTCLAKIWKNTLPYSLNDGTYSAVANAITIVGNDIYVAGYESDGSKNIATVWKNGVASRLTNGEATTIVVSGNDVYVGGQEETSSFTSIAKLWKNGIETVLSDSSDYCFVTSMALSASGVYEVGYGISGNGGYYQAKVWINGVLQNPIQYNSESFLYGIVIDGNDIYYAGYCTNIYTYNHEPTLWKNNRVVFIPYSAIGEFRAVAVKDNDIYVASMERAGNWLTKLYKNRVDSTYTDNTNESLPKSILIR